VQTLKKLKNSKFSAKKEDESSHPGALLRQCVCKGANCDCGVDCSASPSLGFRLASLWPIEGCILGTSFCGRRRRAETQRA
jgi:hypothetical protein